MRLIKRHELDKRRGVAERVIADMIREAWPQGASDVHQRQRVLDTLEWHMPGLSLRCLDLVEKNEAVAALNLVRDAFAEIESKAPELLWRTPDEAKLREAFKVRFGVLNEQHMIDARRYAGGDYGSILLCDTYAHARAEQKKSNANSAGGDQ